MAPVHILGGKSKKSASNKIASFMKVKIMNPLKGELEYGSISLDDKEDYRLYRYLDAGMGETEYRIFRNGAFFAMFDNRKDAEEVMTVMTYKSERDAVLERLHIWFENYCEGNEDPDLWMAFLHAERTLRQAGESG